MVNGVMLFGVDPCFYYLTNHERWLLELQVGMAILPSMSVTAAYGKHPRATQLAYPQMS